MSGFWLGFAIAFVASMTASAMLHWLFRNWYDITHIAHRACHWLWCQPRGGTAKVAAGATAWQWRCEQAEKTAADAILRGAKKYLDCPMCVHGCWYVGDGLELCKHRRPYGGAPLPGCLAEAYAVIDSIKPPTNGDRQ